MLANSKMQKTTIRYLATIQIVAASVLAPAHAQKITFPAASPSTSKEATPAVPSPAAQSTDGTNPASTTTPTAAAPAAPTATSPAEPTVSAPTANTVVPGILQDKRLALLHRIQDLTKKGANTKSFVAYFQQIEETAKKGDESQLTPMINKLSNDLDEQHHMRELAGAEGLRQEVLRTQTSLQNKMATYMLAGKPLPFGIPELQKVKQLVEAHKYIEAKAALLALEKKLK